MQSVLNLAVFISAEAQRGVRDATEFLSNHQGQPSRLHLLRSNIAHR